jgi:hypothetical protein
MIATQTLTFTEILESLRNRKNPRFASIISELEITRTWIKSAVILAELDPDKFAKIRSEGGKISEELFQSAIESITAIAPLDLEFIEVNMDGGSDGLACLYPEPCGYPLGWDEWEEICQDPTDCNDSMALYIFSTCLRFDDVVTLQNASEHFGWDIEIEKLPDLSSEESDHFFGLLKEHGLKCFENAIYTCWYSTGNQYFDYNPYDEQPILENMPEFSMKGVRELEKQWKAAQPILADLHEANDRFVSEKGLARKILEFYLQSQKIRIGPHRRPTTLVELWASEAADQPVIDPFYGPIGLAQEGEENAEDLDGNP